MNLFGGSGKHCCQGKNSRQKTGTAMWWLPRCWATTDGTRPSTTTTFVPLMRRAIRLMAGTLPQVAAPLSWDK